MEDYIYEIGDKIELINPTPKNGSPNLDSALQLEYARHGGLDLVILSVVQLTDDVNRPIDSYAYLVKDELHGYSSYIWPDDIKLRRQHKKSIINHLITKL
jgi:hypothetical protein